MPSGTEVLPARPWHGKVICRVCLDREDFMAWSNAPAMFVIVDCPRCLREFNGDRAELCPCLEDFSPKTIAMAIDRLRAGSADRQEDNAQAAACNSKAGQAGKDEFASLRHALKWMTDRDRPGVPLDGQSSIEQLQHLRAWAEEHKDITIPHPKARLLSHLVDRGMVEIATIPETGELVLRAKNAKEEFSRFLSQLNGSYEHDKSTIETLLCFAYGLSTWPFDPAKLQCYPRGSEETEIDMKGFDVNAPCAILRGNPEHIEHIVRKAYGCVELD